MKLKNDLELLTDTINRMNANRKITRATCPKSDTWFVDGGRCGWAVCCRWCDENPREKSVLI